MDRQDKNTESFYETFWKDYYYQQAYAFDSAVRDRFPAIQKVWGSLKTPDTLLDYGCGNGVLTYWFKANGFGKNILGVDVSRVGIENAIKAFQQPGLTFKMIDEMDEGEVDQFDALVSSHVLEHVKNPEVVLKDLKNRAEWILIEVPLEECLWTRFISLIKGKPRSENRLGHINFWSKKSFRDFIEKSGLMIIKDYHYASAPFSRFNHWGKRWVERIFLSICGLSIYSRVMATHYIILARRTDFQCSKKCEKSV